MNKVTTDFIHDSYHEFGRAVTFGNEGFLEHLMYFNAHKRDEINDETCELLEPYFALDNFNPGVAKKASRASESLCKWVGAMRMYHEAAKMCACSAKLDYLRLQEGKLAAAKAEIDAAEGL